MNILNPPPGNRQTDDRVYKIKGREYALGTYNKPDLVYQLSQLMKEKPIGEKLALFKNKLADAVLTAIMKGVEGMKGINDCLAEINALNDTVKKKRLEEADVIIWNGIRDYFIYIVDSNLINILSHSDALTNQHKTTIYTLLSAIWNHTST
jgi:hypothetical protein